MFNLQHPTSTIDALACPHETTRKSMQYSNTASGRGVQGLPVYGQPMQYSQYGAQPQQYTGMPALSQSQQLSQSAFARFGSQSIQGQGQQQMVPYGGNSQQMQLQQSVQPHRMNTLSGPVNPPTYYPDLTASQMVSQGQQMQQQGQLTQHQSAQNGQGQMVQQQAQQQVQQQQSNQQQVSTQNAAQNQAQTDEPMSKEDRELFKPLQEARAAVEGMLRGDEMAIPTMDGLLSSMFPVSCVSRAQLIFFA